MARINIEDTLWSDDRFLALVEKTGNRASAIGAVVIAFKTAQKFWVPDQRPIPSVQFRSLPFASDLLAAGIAEMRDEGDFVYVHGTKEQFAWLLQRSQAGSENKGKKRERKVTGVDGPDRGVNGREPLTLTLPLSLTLSQKEEEKKNTLPRASARGQTTTGKTIATWEAYRDSYQRRYGVPPVRNATVSSQLLNFIKRLV